MTYNDRASYGAGFLNGEEACVMHRAGCCSVLQRIAVCREEHHYLGRKGTRPPRRWRALMTPVVAACCSVLQCVAVCRECQHYLGHNGAGLLGGEEALVMHRAQVLRHFARRHNVGTPLHPHCVCPQFACDDTYDMTHSYVWRDSFLCATWLIHMCDMTHSYVWRDSVLCATWRIHMCDMTHSYVRHDPFLCVPWLIPMCAMTHSFAWRDSFICVIWRIHICDMTHSYVWHDSFTCVIWLIHVWDMTHSCVWYDSFVCARWLIYIPSTNLPRGHIT